MLRLRRDSSRLQRGCMVAHTQSRAFFTEIVGLRIYLALWVAVGHGLQTAGFTKSNPILEFLIGGEEAVNIFMIVSGFVITNLLLVKQESYGRYIVRRFFRLFPALVIACAVGYALSDEWAHISTIMPWAYEPEHAGYTARIVALDAEIDANLLPHILAHATMIHGLIPEELISLAPMTLLPAAWSVSLEWQFYLVAPMIVVAIRLRWGVLAIIACSVLGLAAYRAGLFGNFAINSILLAKMHFFLVGISSRLAYEKLLAFAVSPVVGASVVAYVSIVLLKQSIPFLIWGVFLCYSLWGRNAPLTGTAFRSLTQPKIFQVLGEASYSLYLIHRPLQVLAVWLLAGFMPLTHQSVLATQFLAIAAALPLSVLVYFTVERWGIGLGRKLSRRIPEGRADGLPNTEPARPAV